MNTYFLAGEIKRLGISLSRVSVISDSVDTIANEVKQFSQNYDFVFTSGGVGPTHDDVTFEGKLKVLSERFYWLAKASHPSPNP